MKLDLEFKFFEDDAGLGLGIAHKNAISSGFNAFWSGIGIFHDVFEHWQEDRHPYFKDQYAFNVGGEMFAMGAMIYLVNNLCFQRFRDLHTTGYRLYPAEAARNSTESEIIEAISHGSCSYGSTLECGVPKQRMSEEQDIEEVIVSMWKNVRKSPLYKPKYISEEEIEWAKNYKKSVTYRKIADLHRYGYNVTKRLYPKTEHNIQEFQDFYEYWKLFTKSVNLRDHLGLLGSSIHFTIHTGSKMRWSATTNGIKITKHLDPEEFLNKYYQDETQ